MGSNGEGTYAKVRGGSGHLASWAQELARVPSAGSVRSLAFGPGNQLAVSRTSTAAVYAMPAAALISEIAKGPPDARELDDQTILSVAFARDGKVFATGSGDGSASLWDAASGACIQEFVGHSGPVRDVVLAPDGRLATASADGTARIWNIRSGEGMGALEDHAGEVLGVDFSRDGSLVGTASSDLTAKIWNDGVCVALLVGHSKAVRKIRFSKLPFLLATCSDDFTAKLWRLAEQRRSTGVEHAECYLTLQGHTDAVNDVAFDKHASAVATVSSDKTIQLWRTPDGHKLRKLTGQGSEVLSVAFSPSGSYIATGTRSGFTLWGVVPK